MAYLASNQEEGRPGAWEDLLDASFVVLEEALVPETCCVMNNIENYIWRVTIDVRTLDGDFASNFRSFTHSSDGQ